jgi:hypothetical protein
MITAVFLNWDGYWTRIGVLVQPIQRAKINVQASKFVAHTACRGGSILRLDVPMYLSMTVEKNNSTSGRMRVNNPMSTVHLFVLSVRRVGVVEIEQSLPRTISDELILGDFRFPIGFLHALWVTQACKHDLVALVLEEFTIFSQMGDKPLSDFNWCGPSMPYGNSLSLDQPLGTSELRGKTKSVNTTLAIIANRVNHRHVLEKWWIQMMKEKNMSSQRLVNILPIDRN